MNFEEPAELLRSLGLLTLALIFSVRIIPALQRHKRMVAYVALAFYFGGGAIVLAIAYLR